MGKKLYLQRHRVTAFLETLTVMGSAIDEKIKFIQDYAAVYRFPIVTTARSLKKLKQYKKAVSQLEGIEKFFITSEPQTTHNRRTTESAPV